ncbi:MAG: inorganic phosphate transporter Pho88 [Benniella sp.]|nr:MAG: inorganic phosphate transporter Pho88 [Benniella sp.]
MNSQLINFGLVIGTIQITKRLNLQNTRTKRTILAIYMAAQSIIVAVSYIIQRRVEAKKDTTVFEYLDQPKFFSKEKKPKLITTTHMKYDLDQNAQARTKALATWAVMMVLYFKFDVVRPLVVQSILPLKHALESEWAQIHLFGKRALGELSRPWKANDPFAALTRGP